MARPDKSDNFKGASVIMINLFILDDACLCKGNGWSPGDIVTWVLNGKNLGNKDYETDHYTILLLKDMDDTSMSAMAEPLENGGELVSRRKFRVDLTHVNVANKTVLKRAEFLTAGVELENLLPEPPQPDEIRVG